MQEVLEPCHEQDSRTRPVADGRRAADVPRGHLGNPCSTAAQGCCWLRAGSWQRGLLPVRWRQPLRVCEPAQCSSPAQIAKCRSAVGTRQVFLNTCSALNLKVGTLLQQPALKEMGSLILKCCLMLSHVGSMLQVQELEQLFVGLKADVEAMFMQAPSVDLDDLGRRMEGLQKLIEDQVGFPACTDCRQT